MGFSFIWQGERIATEYQRGRSRESVIAELFQAQWYDCCEIKKKKIDPRLLQIESWHTNKLEAKQKVKEKEKPKLSTSS